MEWFSLGIQAFINLGLLTMIIAIYAGWGDKVVRIKS